MSDVFFQELGMPQPDKNLGVGSGSHSQQTAEVMTRFEPVVRELQPNLVLVYGDVNSTMAAALVCAKLLIRVGHVEAGLRSRDRTMPEEINRLVTDQLADLLFTPSQDGNDNLLQEGVAPEKIHLVGNVMIDTLVRLLPRAEEQWPGLRSRLLAGAEKRFALVTLHRPSNVDEPEALRRIMHALREIAQDVPIVFPVHPRTRQRLSALGFEDANGRLQLCEPLGYLDFLALQRHALCVITDSGGVQEETTFLGVRCLTMRNNTERPITVTHGTNTLIGQDAERLCREVAMILSSDGRSTPPPPLWDGKASQRLAEVITTRVLPVA
jgi:UDP-N-acetylglucosamine 2-epimerase (non-hydrolysing)